jgi:cytochrome c-type biogenesis protein CcmH/NrfG
MLHAVAVNPRSWMAYLNLSDAEADADPAQALRDCRRALALQPGSAAAWNTLGSLQMANGDRAGAVESFHRARTIAPDVPLFAQSEAKARSQR